jgi:anti-sigma factor RsiW
LRQYSDIVLGAYVDQELDPALAARISADAGLSSALRARIDAIRRVDAAVRAFYDPRLTLDGRPPRPK